MDIVKSCVLMVNVDDTIQRMVIQVLMHKPLPICHQLQLTNLIYCHVIPHPWLLLIEIVWHPLVSCVVHI